MPRTTQTLVGTICDIEEDADLEGFILSANELVTEVCAGVLKDDGTAYYTDVRLELIERWLSAHFYKHLSKESSFESAGRVQVSYQYKVGLALLNTMYGQQALALDTNGGLAALSKQIQNGGLVTAGIHWLGTDPAEV